MGASQGIPYIWTENVVTYAKKNGQRTGQALFNLLPTHICDWVAGTLWDPFHKEFSPYEVRMWIESHLIFNDEGAIVGLFNDDKIIWDQRS